MTQELPRITIEQIDQLLDNWRAKVTLATDNLLALDDSLTYKRLEGRDGLPPAVLSGATKDRVGPALESIHVLFQRIGLLTDVVGRADALRKTINRFRPAESTLREIQALLEGASIQLPATKIPLEERGLLSAAQTAQAVTPDKMLTGMSSVFQAAKAVIIAVDAAWSQLEPMLAQAETEAGALLSLAASLGEQDSGETSALRQRLATMRSQVASDPLGVNASYDGDIAPVLHQVRNRLEDLSRQRDQTRADLQRAHTLFAQLTDVNRQCQAAMTECTETLVAPVGMQAPLDTARVTEMADWLVTLDSTCEQGRWKPTRIGLERWMATMSQYVGRATAALAANQSILEAKAELRGRLSALNAKARARGVAADPSLVTLFQDADMLLHQQPLSLERCTASVAAFESRLNACLRSG